jgi:UDP-N-acetylglucosamine 4,6-dehydratase
VFDGRTVLVTGGAGYFGTRLIRTLFERYDPEKVVVYSRDEWKHSRLRRDVDSPALRLIIGDVRDADRLDQAMRGVDVVVHAAALKQLPVAEYNPMECIRTNVHGADNVINAALGHDVGMVIALSSDKAANPISLYGASKLAADKLFIAANDLRAGRRTRFSVVRHGNLAGSRGSVLPLFKHLLSRGDRELPVTDKRTTRFWLTPQQCVDFVLRGFRRMQGGEIFVPRTPSMRIVDLVESLAGDVSIREVGLRPGEKLHEVLCPADDAHRTLEFDDHFVIHPGRTLHDLDADYEVNPLNERGRRVPEGREYNSRDNPHFLSVEELRRLNDEIDS